MPATAVTANDAPGRFSTTGQILTETAIDVANGNDVTATDNMILLVRNSGASSRTFTITSVADLIYGRTGHVSVSIAAGELRAFRLCKDGWADGNTKINFGGNHAELKVSIVNF